jgi:hypothetical protein
MDGISKLMERAKNPLSLKPDGRYTIPRSFGVYKVTASGDVGRRYRFGNHPVLMTEILRNIGECEVVAVFLDRDDAKQLANELNK